MNRQLTKQLGRFPLGIWIVLAISVTLGLVMILGQALSLVAWDAALSLGLQEDARESTDLVELTFGAVSWGEAVADVVVQGPLLTLTVSGIICRRPVGFVAGVTMFTSWIYAAVMLSFQRVGLYNWGMVADLSRFQSVGLPMLFLVGIPGLVSLVCLDANKAYFYSEERNKSD